jgi:hypothetical protein
LRSCLDTVADDITKTLGKESARALVLGHTGFTHFYPAYRNSAGLWIKNHFASLTPLFSAALNLNTDNQGLNLIEAIAKLPGIPKAGTKGQLMQPEYLLTPAFFALDPRLRFPVINGNEGVQALLKKLNVRDARS